jgi:hypothetical protein
MATSREDIERWLREGKRQNATHVIVVCDTFDWEDYPVFVLPGEDAKEKAAEYGKNDESGLPTLANSNMQKVMEVYSLRIPLEPQLAERRSFHFE